METTQPAAPPAAEWTDIQLAFSTADQEQMMFYSPVGMPAEVPVTLHAGTRLFVQFGPPESGLAPAGNPDERGTHGGRVTVINGRIVGLEPGSPPGARPFEQTAGILRLAEQ